LACVARGVVTFRASNPAIGPFCCNVPVPNMVRPKFGVSSPSGVYPGQTALSALTK
jgi:hypothetical protein